MLLNPADLGVSPEKLRAAEATVAALIGASSLEARPLAQSGVLASGVIPLRDGPLTALTAFTVNGYPAVPVASPWFITAALGASPYGLTPYYGYGTGGAYALTYTAGWTAGNVPEAIREAVRQYATGEATEGPLIAEKLGDVENRYAAPTTSPVSALLAPWRPLRF